MNERQVYLQDKSEELELFFKALEEVQREKPTFKGEILGMNFKEFSATCIFDALKEQELYMVGHYKEDYINLDEEKKIYLIMRTRAEEVFGEEFQDWYLFIKDGHSLPLFDSRGEIIE